MKIVGSVAITGAGMGLGLAMAAEWAKRGSHVLALIYDDGQRAAVEEAVSGLPGTVDIQVLDVTAPGDFSFPDDIEVLINNAGIRLKNLPVEEIPVEEWRLYMDVNFLGAVDLTRRAIPLMRAGGKGTVVNINSGSLTLPFPFLGPYRAAKGAMAAFAETLRTEVAPFGIRVLEIMPGAVRTGLSATSMTTRPPEAVNCPPYAPMAERMAAGYVTGSGKRPEPVNAAVAAERIVDAILSQDGRFRYGTDEMSDRSIEAWRPGGGEPVIAGYIASLMPGEDASQQQ